MNLPKVYSLNFLFSYAFALHHNEGLSDKNIFETIGDSFDSDKLMTYSDFLPFKQIYVEISGWTKNEKFYYKFGYDHYYEISCEIERMLIGLTSSIKS